MAEKAPQARYSHVGICVSDLDRSLRFYKSVFGFVDGVTLEIHNEHQALLGINGDLALRSHFLRLGELVIELLHWPVPGTTGASGYRALNQLGPTHLSFNVDDLDQALALVVANGGKVLETSRSQFSLPHMSGQIIFVCDPDGTRLELMDFPEDVRNA